LIVRDSHLDKVPGFVEFHLLKGLEAEDHTLYASHTVWENLAAFEAWTKSEALRAAHSQTGDNKPLNSDHPQFEGFEVRQTAGPGKTAEWPECMLQPQFCYEHHGATTRSTGTKV